MTTRGYREPRPCPVARCDRSVPAVGKLTCAPHWHALSRELQRAVLATWRGWCRAHTDEAWQAYTTARTAALDALGGERAR